MNRSVWVIALAAAFVLAGCRHPAPMMKPASAELSLEQRREMQTREWAAPIDVVFGATLADLQDQGWTLETVDRAAGLVRATTEKRLDAFGPEDERVYDLEARRRTAKRHADVAMKWSRWKEAVIHIEPWGADTTRQRIVLNLRGTLPSMSYHERMEGPWYGRGRDVMINAPAVEQTVEIDLPEAYEAVFDRIAEGIQRRKAGAAPSGQ